MSNNFEFYNIEEQFADLKINTVGMIGFGVDKNGFLFDEETFELLKFKNKYVNIFIESDEYRNVYPMSMMNSRLFSAFFNIFAKQIEDNGIYIRSFAEEYSKNDEFNVCKSRLVLHVSNGFIYYSNWYYIPGLKFIEMMSYLTDYSASINFASMDSYDVAKAYFVRSQELMNFLSRTRKRREKKFYDFQ